MPRLVFALALVPALVATAAHAQTVSDDVAKQLWCAEAFTVFFDSQKTTITPDTQPMYGAYVAGAAAFLKEATQAYLDAGFTEEQVAKVKADLVTEVTPVVTAPGTTGKYSPDDCNPLLGKYVVLPASSDAPASDASSTEAPAPSAADEGASSAAQ